MTAPELSRRVGADPKAFRAWLRSEARRGNPLVAGHVHNARWEFSENDARELERQWRERSDRVVRVGRRAVETPADPAPTASVAVSWDATSAAAFKDHGFRGFRPLGRLVLSFAEEAAGASGDWSAPGVYAIFCPPAWRPRWRTQNLSNVLRPWTAERLKASWVPDVDLIYVGCAGRTSSSRSLRSRLGDLARHGAGRLSRNGPHKGGERIWQCVGWEDFIIAWIPTGPSPMPHSLEVAIGERFRDLTGSLPFANERL